jgi:hypothetical protein
MAKNGFRVLDSDIHIIEPPDLWARYIDAPFKHQAPRGFADWVLDLPDRDRWQAHAGQPQLFSRCARTIGATRS